MKKILHNICKELFLYEEDMKPIRRFSVIVLILLAVLVMANLNWQGQLTGKTSPIDEVDIFKDFTLQTLDGEPYSADELREYDLVIVDIWATWCFHCVEDMPAMAKFSDALSVLFPGKKVLYLGICTDIVDTNGKTNEALLQTAREISQKAEVHYPQLVADKDFNERFTNRYVSGLPTLFYLDGSGNVIHETGSLSQSGFVLKINELLNMN